MVVEGRVEQAQRFHHLLKHSVDAQAFAGVPCFASSTLKNLFYSHP
jgi:hypothetical protein